MTNSELYEKIVLSNEVFYNDNIDAARGHIEDCLKGYYKRVLFMKGEVIAKEGIDDNKIYFLERGKVVFIKHDLNGKEFSNGYSMPGDFFGLSSIINKSHEVTFKALTNCNIYVIDIEGIKSCKEKNSDILSYTNQMLIKTIRLLMTRHGNMIMSGCKSTFVNFIIEHFKYYGKLDDNGNVIITMDVNLAEIAVILNTTRETLSRIISEMKREEIIETKRKFIKIMDLERFIV